MRLLSAAVSLLLLALPLAAAAQQAYVPIEQRLSADQMRETGLAGLSNEQLRALNALLGSEQAVVEERVEETARSRVAGLLKGKDEPVRSSVQGEFRGWVPGRVIELVNGQRWRVTEGELHLRRPVAAPQATVTPGMSSGWYLQVDGQSSHAKVQLLP